MQGWAPGKLACCKENFACLVSPSIGKDFLLKSATSKSFASCSSAEKVNEIMIATS